MTDDGSTIIGIGEGGPYIWRENQGFTLLPEGVAVKRISADGSTIMGNATVWTQSGGIVSLGSLPGGSDFTRAWDISADGSVVVGESSGASGVEAFRWTEAGGMMGLGDLPGLMFRSMAFGVSADGSVIVGVAEDDGSRAFIWDDLHGMRDLQVLLDDLG